MYLYIKMIFRSPLFQKNLSLNKKLSVLLIFLITLLGFFVRIFNLGENPAGFFADEAAIGYNAYTLLTRGADEYGIPRPFFFRSFGDYRLPVPIYSNLLSIAIFGLNEFSVRLTAAFFGTLTIIFVYLLTKSLFQERSAALLSAFFLAISPWHIHFSRFGSEYTYFPFWFTLSLYLLVKGLKKSKYLILSFISFGVTLYTYYPSLFVTPIFVFSLILIFLKVLNKQRKILVVSIAIFLLSLLPLVPGVKNETVTARWNKVSVFKEGGIKENLSKFGKTYLEHFSPSFLFVTGDISYPGHFITRFSVREVGELYWIQLPLLFLGILYFIYSKGKISQALILLTWFSLYPLGSSLTGTDGGGPFAFRSIIGVVPFQILSSLGIVFLLQKVDKLRFLKKYLKTTLVFSIILLSLVEFKSYTNKYFREYPLYSSDFWGWQYGPREVMKYFLNSKEKYNELYLAGSFNSPEIFIKFYDPENTCKGKCKVGSLKEYNPSKRQLFAIGTDRMKEIPQELSFKKIETIFYPNSQPAFFLGEVYDKKL